VTITSPADNELLAYDSGSGRWINQAIPAHGNEAHNPDFLAVDGSNKMQGDLSGDSIDNVRLLADMIGVDLRPGGYTPWLVLWINNSLLFNTKKGGSVTFSPAPTTGTAENLFDGKGVSVRWDSPSLPVTVEIQTYKTMKWYETVGMMFNVDRAPSDFTVEYYDVGDSAWHTLATVTGNTKAFWFKGYNFGGSGFSALRFTFTALNGSALEINEIGCWDPDSRLGAGFLGVTGGDLYGDIDMHGNDILNVGEITYASSGLKIGKHVLPVLDQDGCPVARVEPDGTIAAKSFVVFSPQVPDDPHEALQVALQEAYKPPLPYKGLCPRESATELQEKIERFEETLEKLNTELKNSQTLAESGGARPTEEIQKEITRVSGKLAELKRRQKIAQEAGTPLAERETYGKDLGRIVFGLLRYVESLEDRLRTLEKALQRGS